MRRALLFACLGTCALAFAFVASAAYATSAVQGLDSGAPARPVWTDMHASARGYTGLGPAGGATATPTQCVTGYTCSVTPAATIVPGTVDTGHHCDECTVAITLPFTFPLYGQTYSTIVVSDNGYAQFVATDTEFDNVCLPFATLGPTIFAYWDDLLTKGTNCTGGCGIYTSISGTSPNRIFNIEWRTFYFSNPGSAYFEIRLNEATASFEVIIGQVNTGATSTTGVQDGAGRFTQCRCNTAPTVNSKIVFTATTGVCGTPVATSTATAVPPTSTPGGNTSTPTRTATASSTAPPQATLTPTSTSPAATSTVTPSRTATACPLPFSDVATTDYFYEPVRYLYCAGVISGYSDNTFRPYNDTTRGQLTKIVVLAEGWSLDTSGGPHFSDVPASNPFYAYIETAFNRGIISGYADGTFRWGANVTRGQLCKIVVLAEEWSTDTSGGPHFSDVPPTQAFYEFVETAFNHEIISGYADGTFRPGNSATRGQICKIVYLAITGP
jgi:hypothetical protein